MSQGDVTSFSSPRLLFGKCLNLEKSDRSVFLHWDARSGASEDIKSDTGVAEHVLFPGCQFSLRIFGEEKHYFYKKANFNIPEAKCKHLIIS